MLASRYSDINYGNCELVCIFENADFCCRHDLQSQPIDEVAKSRKELQDTPMMHVEACENRVHTKKKVSDIG